MDVFTLWDYVLSYVKEHDAQYLEMFTTRIFPVSFQGNILTLTVGKPYLVGWIHNVYGKQLQDIIFRCINSKVEIIVQSQEETPISAPSPLPASSFTLHEPVPVSYGSADQHTPYQENADTENAPFPPIDHEAPFPVDHQTPIDLSDLKPKKPDEVELPNVSDVINCQPSLFSKSQTEDEQKSRESVNYTFDNFVYGMPNQMAYTAARSVAESVCSGRYDKQFNPLFIYGPSGLGKTHLLYAIQNYINEKQPQKKVLFKGSIDFLNELIASIKNNKTEIFRRNYQTVDVLLLDDIQVFGGRGATSLEWFHTFNILLERQKNIIMTSDRTPEDIDKLEDRLQSRFSSGLVAPILPPDFEMCCIILQDKAAKDHIEMPQDVISFISGHINKNIRVLEGAYHAVKIHCEMMHIPITLEAAQDALANNPFILKTQELTVDKIIDTVCEYYEVSRPKLLGTSRPKKIVVPRQVAMFLCRRELGESFPTLATVFNKKDHTSIMYACSKVEKSMEQDPTFKQAISQLHDLLKKR